VERRLSLDLGVTVKIGELASRTGVNASAIRYYEKLSLVPAPYRASGQRCYTDEAIYRVLLIRFAREMDFSLEEIKIFLSGLTDKAPVGKRWKRLAQSKIREVDETVTRARRLKSLLEHLLHCRCASLRECVDRLSLSPKLRLVRSTAK
jgi:MerR family transcriptional regulator, redox-sensitive transcriptional activator SoxR